MTISEKYLRLRAEIPDKVKILVVSKQRLLEQILELYEAGVRDFGENRLPEALAKMEAAPDDIRWHFIGKLQSKKVNKLVGCFQSIHSVDTYPLAELISKASLRKGIKSRVFLQLNCSGEETKSGESIESWREKIEDVKGLEGLQIEGLMTMAPLTENKDWVRKTFLNLREFRDELGFKSLSMGMSQDYSIAIEEGSTLVRLGSLIFCDE